jgi:hypothetical protein
VLDRNSKAKHTGSHETGWAAEHAVHYLLVALGMSLHLPSRLFVTFLAVIGAAWEFVWVSRPDPEARSFGAVMHPWEDLPRDFIILSLDAVALVSAGKVLFTGKIGQRIGAVVLLIIPTAILFYYLGWALRLRWAL